MPAKRVHSFLRPLLVLLVFTVVIMSRWAVEETIVEVAAQVKFAADHEFMVREDGLAAFQDKYGFEFDTVYELVIGFTHEALRAADVDVAMGYATDGKIKQLDLLHLEDDLRFFSVYHAAPVIHRDVMTDFPEIPSLLNPISEHLDTETMVELNYLVGIEDRDKYAVAVDWLVDQGLIELPMPEPVDGPPVRVGSNEFSEHKILGNIVLAVLEAHGIPVEDHTEPQMFGLIREKILNGDIDIYWECSGVKWNAFFPDEELVVDGEEAYRMVAEHDLRHGLLWLDYAPFVHGYAILMRREHAEDLEIETVSDLAQWVSAVQARP